MIGRAEPGRAGPGRVAGDGRVAPARPGPGGTEKDSESEGVSNKADVIFLHPFALSSIQVRLAIFPSD